MSDQDPITQEEMIAMFGEAVPMEAVQLLWSIDGSKTVGELRAELRAIAEARRPEPDPADKLGQGEEKHPQGQA